MRIALVATYTYPLALGLRYVSAYLKQAGHDVRMLFYSSKRDTAAPEVAAPLLAALVEQARQVDLIGMSLVTNGFARACLLTEALRQAGIKAPIVWGGIHPTVAPEESIEIADMVCVGEGERPMLELADTLEAGRDPSAIESFWVRGRNGVVRNPVAPLITNLDELPFPDYDLDTHLIAHDDGLVPVRPKLLRGALHRYRLLSTRGCPYACSFCNNAVQMRVARGKGKWVRRRSNENVIAEIEQMRQRFPTIEAVNIVDDLFFVRDEAAMEEFARAYAARVNLPIQFDAHPNTISRGKIRALSRLPIDLISMGIQSGSLDTLRNLYNRPTPLGKIVEGINALSEAGIKAEYHYLVDNPLEPEENIIETLRFAATHHRGPSILRVFPLQLYPGTPLHDRARAAGVIDEHHQSAYGEVYEGKKYLKRAAYLELWLRAVLALREAGVPSSLVHRLVDFAVHPWVRRVLDRRWFAPACYLGWRTGRTLWKNLLYKPIIRPLRYLRTRRPRRQAACGTAFPGGLTG